MNGEIILPHNNQIKQKYDKNMLKISKINNFLTFFT